MRLPLLMGLLMAGIALSIAHTHAQTNVAAETLERVDAFTKTLDDAQRGALLLPFDDDAREGFNFLPGDRKGLTLKAMKDEQRKAVHDIVKTLLSDRGFEKVSAIKAREAILREMEPGNEAARDPEKYTLAVFGTPGAEGAWGLRWEGHHLSLNWTFINGKIVASSPQFLGTNPAELLTGPKKGDRPLAQEEDLARTLVQSLEKEQRAACVLSDTAPADIISRLDRQAQMQEDRGVAHKELNEEQRGTLETLIMEVASLQAPELAGARIVRAAAAGLENVKFAWMGSTEKGQGHYYRIQGPTFLIEYDNTQNQANHVHLVWRDFKNDFGRDVLAEHYKNAEHAK